MLFEGIVLVNPVFTFIRNLRNKENLIFLLLLPIFLCLIVSPGAAASSSWGFTPENPVVGDIMEIRGTGFGGETVKAMVTFEKTVQVQDGRYEYLLDDIIIPSGLDNSFTVQATGVDDLNVRAKMLLWMTKSAEAKNGIATVSQKSVPSGTYLIRIDGKASDPNVKIKITAMQKVELDSGGSLSYEYNTKSIPAGNFDVKIGGSTKQIELQPTGSRPQETNSSSEQNLSETNSSSKQNLSEGKDNESLEDIAQEESRKSSGNSHGSVSIFSSENYTAGNNSSVKNKESPFMRIKSILETPKAFIFENIKPYIKENSLTEIIRNPPKVPSFLLGFAGTLLIGFAILRKKR